ncbi:MAG: hypothetical protein AAGA31_11570 [Bacteroidota bacterium]
MMYALQDYVGEEKLNEQLASFIDSFALRQQGLYPSSADWYTFIQAATPDSLKYFLKESFEEITLYENRAVAATATLLEPTQLATEAKATAKNTYEVVLKIDTRKIKYDGNGNELAYPTAPSLIEIAVFGADGRNAVGKTEKTPLYLEKRWFTPGEHTITVRVAGEPVMAGVDPYNKLIDRVSEDNLVGVAIE